MIIKSPHHYRIDCIYSIYSGEMSSIAVTDDMIKKLKEYTAEFTKDLPKENLMSCEELWRLMSESDEYILLVDTRSDVEMNVSKIKGSISYVRPL